MITLALHPYTLHFKQPAPTSRGLLRARDLWFVQARDGETGVSGWGECGPIAGLSADDGEDFGTVIARRLAVSRDWRLEIGDWDGSPNLQSLISDLPSLAFGVETALRDLAGGGRGVLWESPFARGEAGLPTHGLLWMDSAAGLLAQAAAKLAAGFRVLKLKVGALPFDEEIALLGALRRRAPHAELRLDANGAWSPQEALDRLDRLRPFGVAFVEQPIRAGQPDALAELCAASRVPVVLDEELIGVAPTDAGALLARIRPHGIIVKPALLGGFAAAETWIDAAEGLGVQWWINSLLESNVGLNAICQWTAARQGPAAWQGPAARQGPAAQQGPAARGADAARGGGRVHGLGTGGLFANNTPAAVEVRGAELWRAGAGRERMEEWLARASGAQPS